MTTNEHGKQIAELWLPGDGNAYQEIMRARNDMTLELSATHHGDHDEFWIVVKENGVETRRINAKQVTEIVWLQPAAPVNQEAV